MTSIAAHRADTTSAHNSSIERVLRHMTNHLDEPMNLDHLSKVAFISKFHFIRVFEETTGVSPHVFLVALRMQAAKQLLLTTDLSVTDICLQIGYSSLGTFCRIFSALVGVSPQSLREKSKNYTTENMYSDALRFLRRQRACSTSFIAGRIDGSRSPGAIFVGAFAEALPRGKPLSGTIVIGPGAFRIDRPQRPQFHLLCLSLPFSMSPFGPLASEIESVRVARVKLVRPNEGSTVPTLVLRPVRITDPPLIVALPMLLA